MLCLQAWYDEPVKGFVQPDIVFSAGLGVCPDLYEQTYILPELVELQN